MRTSQRFAIHRDNLAFEVRTDRLNPAGKGVLKFKRVEDGKDPSKSVVRGNPVGQV